MNIEIRINGIETLEELYEVLEGIKEKRASTHTSDALDAMLYNANAMKEHDKKAIQISQDAFSLCTPKKNHPDTA